MYQNLQSRGMEAKIKLAEELYESIEIEGESLCRLPSYNFSKTG